jgi:flagellar hook protein FlgE
MSFYTSLTGLNAAQAQLGITSNNVANVGTVGFKKSRAEFGDIFTTTSLGNASSAIGQGVLLNKVNQEFSQGNVELSGNSLDLAISGQGFFALKPSLNSNQTVYTRAGSFSVSNDRYVVDSSGQHLQTFPVNDDGSVSATGLGSSKSLQLPSSAGLPKPSSQVELGLNLPASAEILSQGAAYTAANPYAFDRNDSATFNSSTSITVYDSIGNPQNVTAYYVKTSSATALDPTNKWDTKTFIGDEELVPDPAVADNDGVLTFDTFGKLVSPAAGVKYSPLNTSNGSDPLTLNVDYAKFSTQYSAPFSVLSLSQDGYPAGQLGGLDIDSSGVVRANYTNGTQVALGKLMMANFANPNGLRQVGNANFESTTNSGEADLGEAGSEGFGDIQGGSLERANVDLTEELVNLITAQRNFQANAKALETSSSLTQTIMNIRG